LLSSPYHRVLCTEFCHGRLAIGDFHHANLGTMTIRAML
jgi:hypothetical protein